VFLFKCREFVSEDVTLSKIKNIYNDIEGRTFPYLVDGRFAMQENNGDPRLLEYFKGPLNLLKEGMRFLLLIFL